MLHLLAIPVVATATVVFRPLPVAAPLPPRIAAGTEMSCADGTAGGTLVQRTGLWYGNRFKGACTGARLAGIAVTVLRSAALEADAYRVHVLDGECREIGVSDELLAGGAPGEQVTIELDVAGRDWCVGARFTVALEPLRCLGTEPDTDCFPALLVDGTSDAEESAHCAIVVAPGPGGATCFLPRSADGRYFDFELRTTLACDDPGCSTAVAPATWSSLKHRYRDPRPGSPD